MVKCKTELCPNIIRLETALEKNEEALRLARQMDETRVKLAKDEIAVHLSHLNEAKAKLDKVESSFVTVKEMNLILEPLKKIIYMGLGIAYFLQLILGLLIAVFLKG